MSRRSKVIGPLLREHAARAMKAAQAADAMDYPNTVAGDRLAMDAGALCERGLAVWLEGPELPRVNSGMTLRLIQRAAAAYSIDLSEQDMGCIRTAPKLQLLALLLIRDHRRDLYEVGQITKWTRYRKQELAQLVDLIRDRDGLSTDVEALTKIRATKIFGFDDNSVARLTKYLGEGRRLAGSNRGRGRPAKLVTKGQNKAD